MPRRPLIAPLALLCSTGAWALRPAHAHCSLERVETGIKSLGHDKENDEIRWRHTERYLFSVRSGQPDCGRLFVAHSDLGLAEVVPHEDPAASPAAAVAAWTQAWSAAADQVQLDATIHPADARRRRVAADRWTAGVHDGDSGWWLSTPELRRGDVLEVEATWSDPRACLSWRAGTVFRPGGRDEAIEVASAVLEVHHRDQPTVTGPGGAPTPEASSRAADWYSAGPGAVETWRVGHCAPLLLTLSGTWKPTAATDLPSITTASTRVELGVTGADPLRAFSEPGLGLAVTEQRIRWDRRATDPSFVLLPVPDGAAPVSASVQSGDTPIATVAQADGWRAMLPEHSEGPVELRWSWAADTLPSAGRLSAPAGLVGEWSGTVMLPSGRLDGTVGGAGDLETSGGGRVLTVSGGPGTSGAWRVTSLGGEPVLPDRAALLQGVARPAVHASMPEPALPLGFKNREPDDQTIVDLVDWLHATVRTASLPGPSALRPRPLIEARNSGFASAWEQSLLMTRYLRQFKLEAFPVPVRTLDHALDDAASPLDWDDAVVLLRRDGSDLWIDPACRTCALGEVRPRLWGAEALSDAVDALPAGPEGHRTRRAAFVQRDGIWVGRAHVELRGPEAQQLREGLGAWAIDARAPAVAAALGGAGATLSAHEGLTEAGQPILLTVDQLMLDAEGRMLPLGLPDGLDGPAGPAGLLLSWSGERVDHIVLQGVVLQAEWSRCGAPRACSGVGRSWLATGAPRSPRPGRSLGGCCQRPRRAPSPLPSRPRA